MTTEMITEINTKIENAVNWIDELWENDYKQGFGNLGNVERGFCCLGVAAHVCDFNLKPYYGSLLAEDSYKKVGLKNGRGGFETTTKAFFNNSALTVLNDSEGYSFQQIAILLSRFPERFFIDSVAKGIKNHYDGYGYPDEELYDD